MPQIRQIQKLILVGIACVFLTASANAQAPQVSLRTVYLADPIGTAHQITVRGELGGEGEVVLDGNTCTIGLFGDVQVCTEIFFRPIPVKFQQLRLADPSGAGRRIFQVTGELRPDNAKYYLIVPRRRSQAHRLVVDLGDDHRRVVSLEAVPKPAAKPELCRSATYQASQREGKVTIMAKGEHPSAGWKVAFEQLPIRIFPPQFRLVCSPPPEAAAQVITPFEVSTSFASNNPVKQVIVHDHRGQHKIPVTQN